MWSVSLGYKNYMVTTHGDNTWWHIGALSLHRICESLVWDKAFRCFCSGALTLTLFDRTWELAKPKEQVLYCTVSIHQLVTCFFLRFPGHLWTVYSACVRRLTCALDQHLHQCQIKTSLEPSSGMSLKNTALWDIVTYFARILSGVGFCGEVSDRAFTCESSYRVKMR